MHLIFSAEFSLMTYSSSTKVSMPLVLTVIHSKDISFPHSHFYMVYLFGSDKQTEWPILDFIIEIYDYVYIIYDYFMKEHQSLTRGFAVYSTTWRCMVTYDMFCQIVLHIMSCFNHWWQCISCTFADFSIYFEHYWLLLVKNGSLFQYIYS